MNGPQVAPDQRAWVEALVRVGRALLRIPRRLAWLPPVLWMGGIWLLSSIDFDSPLPPSKPGMFAGNLFHTFEYGVLTLLALPLLPRHGGWVRLGRGAAVALLAGALAYGLIDEIHQSSTGGRESSLLDVFTDGVGAACVLAIAAYVGAPEATDPGLRRRLLVCLAACCAAAGLATGFTLLFGTGLWPGAGG